MTPEYGNILKSLLGLKSKEGSFPFRDFRPSKYNIRVSYTDIFVSFSLSVEGQYEGKSCIQIEYIDFRILPTYICGIDIIIR